MTVLRAIKVDGGTIFVLDDQYPTDLTGKRVRLRLSEDTVLESEVTRSNNFRGDGGTDSFFLKGVHHDFPANTRVVISI